LHRSDKNQAKRFALAAIGDNLSPQDEGEGEMRIYGLKNCDTCRKAMKALPQAELVDVRVDGVPDEVMAKAHSRFGDKLLNTRSTTWRGLSEDERATPPLALLAAHPALMKRPLIVDGDQMYLGWDKATQGALGVSA